MNKNNPNIDRNNLNEGDDLNGKENKKGQSVPSDAKDALQRSNNVSRPRNSTSDISQGAKTNIAEVEKINIWSAENTKPEFSNKAGKSTKPRWGVRHAVYAFLAALLLQLVVSIPFIFPVVAQLLDGNLNAEITDEQLQDALLNAPGYLFAAQLSMYVGWFAVGLYVTMRLGLHSFAKDFWFKFRWVRDISLGILLAIGLRALEVLVFAILGNLGVDLTGADNSSVFTDRTGIWGYLLLFGVVSFLGPLSEEFLFRGMLLQGLIRNFRRQTFEPRTAFGSGIQRTYPPLFNAFIAFKSFLYKHKYILAAIISSVAFGFMHFQGTETFGQWLVVIETGLIGFVFALVVLKTKRLGLAIVAHMVFNFSAVALTLWF